MALGSRPLALVLAVAMLSSGGCISDSLIGSRTKSRMLATALPGYELQVITLRVRDTMYGRLTVEQAVIDILRRREGVLDVKRGSGREELYVLTETRIDPYSLAKSAPARFNVRVLAIDKPELPEVPK